MLPTQQLRSSKPLEKSASDKPRLSWLLINPASRHGVLSHSSSLALTSCLLRLSVPTEMMVTMQVFISSVRRGLEEERDALPGLISAIGHEPLRFEDFTAEPVPSRQACIDGVANADVYVLLLGEHYGHRFDDAGQSPTHDEWVAAQQAGIPRLVFRKADAKFEPDQEDFSRKVGNYTSGVFYESYSSTADLLTKVAAALRNLAQTPGPLTWSALTSPVTVSWRSDFDHDNSHRSPGSAQVEIHVVPVPGQGRSRRQLTELHTTLPARIRGAGVIDDSQPLQLDQDADGGIRLNVPAPNILHAGGSGMSRVSPAHLTGARIAPDGQVSIWSALPGDMMGAVLDVDDLAAQCATMLRVVGALSVISSDTVALAAGLSDVSMLSIGKVADLPRSQSYPLSVASSVVLVEPEELVTVTALGTGAVDAARSLAASVVDAASRR